MQLKRIMKPWKGNPEYGPGLSEDTDLYELKHETLDSFGDTVAIINTAGQKTGEIKKYILQNVIRAYSQDLIALLLDHLNEGIIAINEAGTIFYVNEMYSDIMGNPIGKIIGRSIHDVEPGAALGRVLQDRREIVLDHQYVKTIKKYVACKLSPLFLNDCFRGAVSIFSDATEIVNLNRQVRQAEQMASDLQQQIQMTNELKRLKIVGKNPTFLKVVSQAAIVAKTDVPVLIRGENGTGKEIIAQFIHKNSPRAQKALITVNCASIPDNLIESELFGYEEGAFTGSRRGGKAGKFELASGGTLFLDEVGDISPAAQTKLLRTIQDNEIERLGSEKKIAIDVRIITATNQNLEEIIEEKKFRLDFYYRINTVTLYLPALRERPEDIPVFANHFLQEFNQKYKKNVSLTKQVLAWMCHYSWPGNVREMKNCIENGVIMAQNDVFDLSHIAQHMDAAFQLELGNAYHFGTLKEELEKVECKMLLHALAVAGGSREGAMRLLGLGRRSFYRKLQYYNISKPRGAVAEGNIMSKPPAKPKA